MLYEVITLIAWLLARQRFAGKRAFEFGAMLSFAIPGTVIGVSYIIAFNVPPVEITGTGLILIIAFVFRNMPVGIRAGVANFAQLDPSLDEASLTLRASVITSYSIHYTKLYELLRGLMPVAPSDYMPQDI